MKKTLILLLLLLLVACGSAEPPANSPEAQGAAAVTDTANNAAVEPEGNVAETAVSSTETPAKEPPAADDAGITPATTPTEAAQVRPQDWTIGASDPLVTIIEYGDFQ